jgi:hypothetical protein
MRLSSSLHLSIVKKPISPTQIHKDTMAVFALDPFKLPPKKFALYVVSLVGSVFYFIFLDPLVQLWVHLRAATMVTYNRRRSWKEGVYAWYAESSDEESTWVEEKEVGHEVILSSLMCTYGD